MLSVALPFDLAGELWTMKKFLKTKKTREAIAACPSLTADGAGAIYLFTCESPLYKELNAKLRARDRAALKVRPNPHNHNISQLQNPQIPLSEMCV